ncbi:MAG: phosphate ABC transporter substrate-binding protein, partial [Firmicutes bacterium]|nr:phosphate ABC transporter substrate-binding protein [Bacillota bacterium]
MSIRRKIILCALLPVLLFSLLFSGCVAGSGGEKHSILVVGSTSVQPYAELLAESFEHGHKGYRINVSGGGSGAGISAAHDGKTDIGMSSRKLKTAADSYEKDLWFTAIAMDGLAIIVHPDNPVKGLSKQQFQDIYAGKIKNWDQIEGFSDWAARANRKNAEIHLVTREDGSGTRSAFEEVVMGTVEITNKAIVQNSNGSIRNYVSGNPNAIGFISLGLVPAKGRDKKVVALDLDGVKATEENVSNETYALSRP